MDKFVVGDFVWGKINRTGWWPAVIYDTSDASEFATKLKIDGGLLTAFFGGDAFAWCHPRQLKPFDEYFVEFSKSSDSHSFHSAINNALNVIGRLIEWKQACSSILKQNTVALERPLAKNTGIKEGIFVPMDGIQRFQVFPGGMTAKMRPFCQGCVLLNMLDQKKYVSTSFCAKERYPLPLCSEPHLIPMEKLFKMFIPKAGPFVDNISAPLYEELLRNFPQTNIAIDDEAQPGRKRRKIVEIMRKAKRVRASSRRGNMRENEESANEGSLALPTIEQSTENSKVALFQATPRELLRDLYVMAISLTSATDTGAFDTIRNICNFRNSICSEISFNPALDAKSPSTSLLAEFGPGSVVPSREQLLEVFKKFSNLVEDETKISHHSFSALVVFASKTYAEEALKECVVTKLFKNANVTFKPLFTPSVGRDFNSKDNNDTGNAGPLNTDEESSKQST